MAGERILSAGADAFGMQVDARRPRSLSETAYDAIEQMQMYPWRVILPGLFISLTVLCVNYIGDGLRDAMDPRIRGR